MDWVWILFEWYTPLKIKRKVSVYIVKKITNIVMLLIVMGMVVTQQSFRHILPHDNFIFLYVGLVILCGTIGGTLGAVLTLLQKINAKLQEAQKNR